LHAERDRLHAERDRLHAERYEHVLAHEDAAQS